VLVTSRTVKGQLRSAWSNRLTRLTVTVEVKGLPAGCHATASNTVIYDPAPEPVKLFEIHPEEVFDKAAANRSRKRS
jgi:hypothetical protein